MTADEALTAALKANPASVLILAEQPGGKMSISVGPDMTLEHISFLLDQAKYYILSRGIGPVQVPATGVEANAAQELPSKGPSAHEGAY